MPNPVEILAAATIARAAPLALAALGGYWSERSGVIDIGLEGKMLGAACLFAVIGARTGNVGLALGAAILASSILALTHWLVTQKYQVDQVISGMALNALAFGAVNYLNRQYMEPGSTIPRVADAWFIGLAILLPFAAHLWVTKTRPGLRVLAVGSDPDKARLAGIQPHRVRLGALVATGVLTGLSGALILNSVGNLTDTMTAGRGYIALAALILGGWRPVPTLIACLLFGMLEALQLVLQGTTIGGVKVPTELWNALPYIATVIALGGLVGKTRAPGGLGKA